MADTEDLETLRNVLPDGARLVSNIIDGKWDSATIWSPEDITFPEKFAVVNENKASGKAPAVTVGHPKSVNEDVAGQKKYTITAK